MCGICGILRYGPGEGVDATVRAMTRALAHRGPDDEGIWLTRRETWSAALGNRRLAILDLSPHGHMPMVDPHTGSVMTYNGELYNYLELRRDLESAGHTFTSTGDTEVVLAAYRQWGVDCVRRFNGMYAIAIFDPRQAELVLIRDRLGKKPLYYYTAANLLLFGQELKALMACPEFPRVIDRQALAVYLTMGRIPSPLAIFQNTRKLPPGCYLRYHIPTRTIRVVSYWSPALPPENGWQDDPAAMLEELLDSAVQLRLRSDVPVGCIMSSGTDSAVVAAVSNRMRPGIQTFTVGFGDRADERVPAREISAILGTDHHEFFIEPGDFLLAISRLPDIADEPLAFPAIVPTYLVFSRMREAGIKVVLVGDGGDELFWGYEPGTYANFRHVLRLRRFRRLLAGFPGALSSRLADIDSIARRVPLNWLNHLRRLRLTFEDPSLAAQYFSLGRFVSRQDLGRLLGGDGVPDPIEILQIARFGDAFERHPLEAAGLYDIYFNLADFNLDRVDRASMANSVEARAPLLDYRLVELALRIPVAQKYAHGRTKLPLKRILGGYLPRRLWDRPKQGFDTPAGRWLREHLRDQAYDLLAASDGLLDQAFLLRRFRRHLDGGIDELNVTWPAFVFLQWWDRWGRGAQVAAAVS